MRRRAVPLVALMSLALAAPASANMGTPLMWLGFLQLAFGNAIIGAIEALTLRFAFQLPYRRGLVLMTCANYASLVIGWFLLQFVEGPFNRIPPSISVLLMLPKLIAVLWVVLFIWTVLAEAPFVHRLFPPEARSWYTTLKASLLAQTVSSLFLAPLYLSASNYSFVTQTKIQPDLRFVQAPAAQVYYIGLDGNIWRVHIDGTGKQKVKDANATDPSARLYAKRDRGTGRWDLWCSRCGRSTEGDVKLLEGISLKRMPTRRTTSLEEKSAKESREVSQPRDMGMPLDYRPLQERDWTVFVDVWAERGLQVYHHGQRSYTLGMETPFIAWFTRWATCLPGDYVVFNLGDYILILHIPTRRLGFLAAGRCPLVVMPDRDAPKEPESS